MSGGAQAGRGMGGPGLLGNTQQMPGGAPNAAAPWQQQYSAYRQQLGNRAPEWGVSDPAGYGQAMLSRLDQQMGVVRPPGNFEQPMPAQLPGMYAPAVQPQRPPMFGGGGLNAAQANQMQQYQQARQGLGSMPGARMGGAQGWGPNNSVSPARAQLDAIGQQNAQDLALRQAQAQPANPLSAMRSGPGMRDQRLAQLQAMRGGRG